MTANPKPSTEAQRRAAIKRRRETSTFWMSVHLLGSLNLAVILLITIAGAIAFATIMESKFDSAVARYYIYNAAWFNVWLLALALNLLCAAFTRWPWQKKHIGFVITHAGIILMLTGAVVGRIWGFEAYVTLDKTKPPENRLVMHEDLLTIDTSHGIRGQMPFDTEIRPPTEKRPFVLPLEDSALKLVIDRATENLVPDDLLAPSSDPIAPAGVALHFVNAGMGQNVPANLMQGEGLDTFDFFGMAKIEMVDSLDETHLLPLPASAEPAAAPTAPRNDSPFHETHLAFANAPATPLIDTDADMASGYKVVLVAGAQPGEFDAVVTGPSGTSQTIPAHDNGDWTSLFGDGDPVMFRVAKYWPDFAMKNGVPVSQSDKPNNPVVLVQITGPTKVLPPPAPKPAAQTSTAGAPPMPKGLVLRVAMAREAGRMVYELEREGKIEARGVAAQGDMIRLGWSKWQAKVDSVLPHAELHRDMKELTGDVTPMMAATLRPGIRAHLVAPDGTSGPAEWVPEGTSRELFNGQDFATIGFGERVIPLTFSITLENFEVPRDEGTDTPANYISTLRFDEPSTGRVVQGEASMNSPAMFPGDFWRSLLGWNYKFSQANWNPQNLNETTLQVLYDPGWLFKWVGSICICCGIALMFWFMPKRSADERAGRDVAPEEDLATKNTK